MVCFLIEVIRYRHGILTPIAPETLVKHVVRNVLRRRDAKTFIDVGAFIGWYSLYAYRILRKRKGAIIIAIEPDPKTMPHYWKIPRDTNL